MRHISRGAALLLLMGLVLPALAQDKKPDPKKDSDKHLNTEKMVKAGQVAGKIVAIVESKKSIRLQVQVPQLNVAAVTAYATAEQQYALAVAKRDVGGAQAHLRTMAQQEANLYTLVAKDIEVETTEDVKVRLGTPPPKFDDKGKIAKYTQKELQEMKGPDPKLPGYSGEFADLQQEQIVLVYLVKKKTDAPRPVKPRGKDADPDLLKDFLPQVSMIVVLADPIANGGK